MRVIVCGGRNYADQRAVFDTLEYYSPTMVIQGGASGADMLARKWCVQRGVMCVEVLALWSYYGRSAGPTRNKWMTRLDPDMVLAFPGGRGTASMVRIAEEAGIEVELSPSVAPEP